MIKQVFYSEDPESIKAFKSKFPDMTTFDNQARLIDFLRSNQADQLILELGKGPNNAISVLIDLSQREIRVASKLLLTNQPLDDLSLRLTQLLQVEVTKKSDFISKQA